MNYSLIIFGNILNDSFINILTSYKKTGIIQEAAKKITDILRQEGTTLCKLLEMTSISIIPL